MKTYKGKILAIALTCACALPLVGCNKGGTSSLTEEELNNILKQDLTISVIDPGNNGGVIVNTTAPSGSTPASNVTTYTDKPVVAVTDTQGTIVTEAGGAMKTEPYTAPTTTTTTSSSNETTYQKNVVTQQALWIDMTKRKDFVFDGEFLVFKFKIKEVAPDGVYDIKISHTDFANYDAHSLPVTAINGKVGVNQDVQDEAPSGSNFVVHANAASAKQGDTVEIKFDLTNNPGFVGFDFQFQYDSGALECLEGTPGSDFSSRTNVTMTQQK